MRKNVFIIGAAKCGTTALANMLGEHRDICLSLPKETDFFTDRIFTKGFDWYNEKFLAKPDATYWLDASVSYSAGWGGSSKNIARRIFDYNPDSKIIYVVRDPVARTWSAFWHNVKLLREKQDFRSAVSDHSSDYITASLYCQRIEDYLALFNHQNLMIVEHGRVAREPQQLLNEITDFLQLERFELEEGRLERRVNSSFEFNPTAKRIMRIVPVKTIKKMAFWTNRHFPPGFNAFLKKFLSRPVPQISPSDANYLVDLYANEMEKLTNTYGIDVRTGNWWHKS